MAVEYLACGNIMSDRIERQDGSFSEWNMGGPAFFALSGIRLWTKACKLVCRTGEDYASTYGRWMDANGVSRESVQVEAENVTRFTLKYNPDGSFSPTPHFSMEHLGYLKTHPEEIDQACAGQAVKGIYMAHNLDPVIWGKLGEVKEKYGFKIMWEIEYAGQIRKMLRLTRQQILDRARRVMEVADLWSINHNEAADLFQLPREDDEAIINELQKLPVEFTFYRVGSRGSYAVTPTNAYFCEAVDPFGPSVDPTGCGNCSTGAAMYAYVSGEHPAMAAVMANISSGFNAAQKGPYPLYTEEDMQLARRLAAERFEALGLTVPC